MDLLFEDVSGINLIECRYHTLLCTLTETINERLEDYYNWEFFGYWLGDESNFDGIYTDSFRNILSMFFNTQLNEEQRELIRNKGRNLEINIGNWLRKWKNDHPERVNEKMPLSCLKYKIHEYIVYQLRGNDLRNLVGNPC